MSHSFYHNLKIFSFLSLVCSTTRHYSRPSKQYPVRTRPEYFQGKMKPGIFLDEKLLCSQNWSQVTETTGSTFYSFSLICWSYYWSNINSISSHHRSLMIIWFWLELICLLITLTNPQTISLSTLSLFNWNISRSGTTTSYSGTRPTMEESVFSDFLLTRSGNQTSCFSTSK